MVYEIIWSVKARKDLRSLYEYYSEKNRNSANRMVSEIGIRTQQLTEQPEMAALEPQLINYVKEFRSLVVLKGNYKIIYYFENNIIHISRIWDWTENSMPRGNLLQFLLKW